MNNQACWTDIPPELVDEILQYCDRRSLLILSRVNHQLSSLAISRYFTQQITGDVIRIHPTDFSDNFLQRTSFSTFRLPRNIQHIDYRLASYGAYPKGDHYINDLRGLTILIRRLSKLASLSIDLGSIDLNQSPSKKSHSDIWAKLVDAAASKKCERLEIGTMDRSYIQAFSPLEAFKASRGSILRPIFRLFHSLGQASTPKDAAAVTTQDPSPLPSSLTAKIIQTFQHKVQLGENYVNFLPPTFRTILLRHTISITYLSLTFSSGCNSKKLKKAFDRIHLPALKYFSFAHKSGVSPYIFLEFLYHHPSLSYLDLDVEFAWWASYDERTPTKRTPQQQPLNFPNLQTLRIFPEVFRWWVPDLRRCPKLRSIALKSRFGDNPQNATISILKNIHTPTLMAWPVEVEIQFPPSAFRSHWVPGLCIVGSGGTSPCWSRVKRLTLERACLSSGALVDLVSVFPSLERLIVRD